MCLYQPPACVPGCRAQASGRQGTAHDVLLSSAGVHRQLPQHRRISVSSSPITSKRIPTPQKDFLNGRFCPLLGGGKEEWGFRAGFSDEELASAFATGSWYDFEPGLLDSAPLPAYWRKYLRLSQASGYKAFTIVGAMCTVGGQWKCR